MKIVSIECVYSFRNSVQGQQKLSIVNLHLMKPWNVRSPYMCVVRMVCNYCTLHNTKVHAKDCGFVRAGGHSLVFRVLATQVTTPDCFSLFRFTTPNKHVFTAEAGYVPTQFTMLHIVAVPGRLFCGRFNHVSALKVLYHRTTV